MHHKILTIYAISGLLGILVGLMGTCFQLAIHGCQRLIDTLLAYCHPYTSVAAGISISISVSFMLSAWLLVRFFAPEAAGSGIQEIEGTLRDKRPMYWRRLLPVKFVGGVLAISAHAILGREGPTMQMGGNLGEMVGEVFHIKHARRHTLIMAGAAAGLAAAFNAPLAGVLFVMEEMRNEFNFNFTNFKMVLISCVLATITMRFILGSAPAIPMPIFVNPSVSSLILFWLFGLLVGVVGLLFNHFLMFSLSLNDKLNTNQRLYYVVLIGVLVGFFTVYYPAIVGGGYDIIHQSLILSPGITVLVSVFIIRLIAMMLCYSTGVPGGIFAPIMALGTLLGLLFFSILNALAPNLTTIHPGMFAVAGMGALFAAAVRAPVTGIILVVEMTQNYSLILPLMVSCLTSTTVMQLAKNKPIYTQLLQRTLNNQRKEQLNTIGQSN